MQYEVKAKETELGYAKQESQRITESMMGGDNAV